MAEKVNNEQKPKKVVAQKKPKLVKKKYPLIKDVTIKGVLKKKGTLIELTDQGKQHFKSKFYI